MESNKAELGDRLSGVKTEGEVLVDDEKFKKVINF